ncbi:hypothetical protein EBB79_22335 (plasmid) [Parasedimentitalea marina]|uniref:Sulfotransferase domain-containing protein n=1 Tax=Parasedimentitalea marina TaxID=2483033 RepID=A0A3T0N9M8_9RHOB|nr:sulfotransferase domain-containing protein [Parasedimentitalea marina]AZV80624.1 hypothetical protein EBB79_21915 [Parasedimentitalea marina]AZV80691.1 hypothetical protein EBB79_22335 [Parasedimentitalea marina]
MTTAETATGVIWLASYPKSGNTWLREILTNILSPKGTKRGEAIPSFQKDWPGDIPHYQIRGQAVHLMKTHLHPGHARMDNCPLPTAGAITIRRHPLDVLLSALNYAKIKEKAQVFLDQEIKPVEQIIADGEFSHYIDQFRDTDGFSWFAGPAGELSLHRQRWQAACIDLAYHEICYEDLFADPEAGIRALLDFLQIDASAEEISRIYERADRRTAQNGTFFWKRRAYNFQDLLPPELIAEFHEKYSPQLTALDYPTAP